MEILKTTEKQLLKIREKICNKIITELQKIGDGSFDDTYTIKTTFKEPLREINFNISGNIEVGEFDITHLTLYIDTITVLKDEKCYRLEIDTTEIEKYVTKIITE